MRADPVAAMAAYRTTPTADRIAATLATAIRDAAAALGVPEPELRAEAERQAATLKALIASPDRSEGIDPNAELLAAGYDADRTRWLLPAIRILANR